MQNFTKKLNVLTIVKFVTYLTLGFSVFSFTIPYLFGVIFEPIIFGFKITNFHTLIAVIITFTPILFFKNYLKSLCRNQGLISVFMGLGLSIMLFLKVNLFVTFIVFIIAILLHLFFEPKS